MEMGTWDCLDSSSLQESSVGCMRATLGWRVSADWGSGNSYRCCCSDRLAATLFPLVPPTIDHQQLVRSGGISSITAVLSLAKKLVFVQRKHKVVFLDCSTIPAIGFCWLGIVASIGDVLRAEFLPRVVCSQPRDIRPYHKFCTMNCNGAFSKRSWKLKAKLDSLTEWHTKKPWRQCWRTFGST